MTTVNTAGVAKGSSTSVHDLTDSVLDLFPAPSDDATPAASGGSFVCYSRFSTAGQKETSIERQYENHLACARRNGLIAAADRHHFTDSAQSGARTENRHGLKALLAFLRTGAARYVLVESIDRLSRRVADVVAIYEEWKTLGVEIILSGSASGQVDDITAVIHALFAQEQRRKIVSITSAGRRQAAAAGGNMARVPYGYDRGTEAGELVIDEEEAIVVRRIFRLLGAGLSPGKIAHLLNSEGIPSPDGRIWLPATIYNRHQGIVRNAKYCGINLYNRSSGRHTKGRGRFVPKPRKVWSRTRCDAWRIVDPVEWIDVNRMLAERSDSQAGTSSRERTGVRSISIFKDRYFCSCGASMICKGRSPRGLRQIKCSTTFYGPSCGSTKSISLAWVEYELLSEIEERIICPEAIELFEAEYAEETRRILRQDATEGAALRARIETLSDWLAHSLIDAVTRGLATEDVEAQRQVWTSERNSCRAKLAAIAVRRRLPPDINALKSLRSQIATLKSSLPLREETEADMELTAALRRLVSRIVVSQSGGEEFYTLTVTSSLDGEDGSTVERRCRTPVSTKPGRKAAVAAALESAKSGRFALGDDDWALVGPLLERYGPKDKRSIVDGALLVMRTGMPLVALPEPYGGQLLAIGVRRLARRGGLREALEALTRASSPAVSGLATDACSIFE